jgi:hypothetical protein
LVLAAIEQDDLPQVQLLARESEAIIASLHAYQEAHGPLPGDAREVLEHIQMANERIVFLLQEQAQETAAELVRTRTARAKLRASRLPDGPPSISFFDRDT